MLVVSRDIEKDMWEALRLSQQLKYKGLVEDQETLESQLSYLAVYACHEGEGENGFDFTRVFVSRDFAPYSFSLTWYAKAKEGKGLTEHDYPARDYPELVGYAPWFNGGLIFHGKVDGNGSGSFPTLSVTLEPVNGWSVHT